MMASSNVTAIAGSRRWSNSTTLRILVAAMRLGTLILIIAVVSAMSVATFVLLFLALL